MRLEDTLVKVKAAHAKESESFDHRYKQLSERSEKSLQEKDTQIAELEEEVRSAVADWDGMVVVFGERYRD